jgi:REP element-mobilizing transposase RayT
MQGYRAYRRYLPHYEHDNRNYYVTFCTRARWILPPLARDVALEEFVVSHGVLIDLRKIVIMPNHVHAILAPLLNEEGHSQTLADILRLVKGRSARRINLALGRVGSVWQREFFDRQLRGSEDHWAKCEYIAQNPVRKGIVDRPEDYPWIWPR